MALPAPFYKLCFYVPQTHVESVKQAVFAAGAGQVGRYSQCSWQVLGTGQFKPESGAQPFLGQVHQLEQVSEWRVETIVEARHLQAVIQALKQAHPYEEPAYDVIQTVLI